ncbi:hypothetical protein SARC_08803 [Sphaeroforma arctica JP610]|uniref:Tim44-like domain-containing protein n=1 Tax=Sphaeroforma arctica JP610 TaxID=667725 RepID=A0A0L0FPN5_9EUKA|nr:hypothetical protein SARC_08803 [Sphaeroforma arctica JP610]KNC78775.1 hypothetical protein SARC_08803 [Sphaeroforma arctica JP610]|eukprot:XP_014152677.1 hypothetical protein SARC_08803 [Sphaeroforma arctica JP610]
MFTLRLRCSPLAACVNTGGHVGQASRPQARHMSMVKNFLNSIKKGAEETAPKSTPTTESVKSSSKMSSKKGQQNAKKVSETLGKVKDNLGQVADELGATKFAKQAGDFTAQAGKEAGKATQQIGAEFSNSDAAHKISQLRSELLEGTILDSAKFKPYQKPSVADRERIIKGVKLDKPIVEANTDATGMVMHKDSVWFSKWKEFKDNNPITNRAFEWKMHYDESDNIFVRSMRSITDVVADGLSGMFKESEMITVLREICKQDPDFEREEFIEHAHKSLIPVLLESYFNQDLQTLEAWCSEPTYNVLASNIKLKKDAGHTVDVKILDIRDVDIFNAMMMEQGPVLTVTCMVQQITVEKDKAGKVVDGDPDAIEDVLYAFAFCREEGTYGKAAWRVMDFAMHMRRSTW